MSDEAVRILNNMAVLHDGWKTRTTTNVARELLIHGSVVRRGHVVQIYGKSIGAGVWEVWAGGTA